MEIMSVRERIQTILEQIELEAHLAKRQASEIRLIGVCKHQSAEKIRAALQAGLQELGQNYVQELMNQAEELGDDFKCAHWHFIGKLQRNKAKDLIKLFPSASLLIHTLDRPELARTLDEAASKCSMIVSCLIQVMPEAEFLNQSERSGCRAEEVVKLLRIVRDLPNLAVKGLMILPPLEEKPEDTRRHFHFLRQLGKSLQSDIAQLSCERVQLQEYSMGMTADWKEALHEGATYIRIGTGIFGERETR